MFGVINSLFSGLGLAGLIYTLLLQRESLETQRKELQKQEMELEIQSREIKQQRFESSFIQILQIHNNLTRSLRIFDEKNNKFIHGVDCFSYLSSWPNGIVYFWLSGQLLCKAQRREHSRSYVTGVATPQSDCPLSQKYMISFG
ncbi:hypothetical protein [Endozoicomonas acroporae]|uniref:hypothetical protein n=1 Tax=Endozoicomonas acroporae TaxID=1701104 RepID=UPI0013D0292F|nr:hypothetical protein [Endozoicomonas acroporae]